MSSTVIMAVFGIILIGLGVFLLVHAILMKKNEEVPDLFLDIEDRKKCRDMKALARDLYPAVLLFSIVSMAFGVEEFLNLFLHFPRIESVIAVAIFLVAWAWFSHVLKKGKEKYCTRL